MKTLKKYAIVFMLTVGLCLQTTALGMFGLRLFDNDVKTPLFISEQEERVQRLEAFKTELAASESKEKEQVQEIKNRSAEIERELALLADKKTRGSRHNYELISKKEAALRDMQQSLASISQSRIQRTYQLKECIKTLEGAIASSPADQARTSDKSTYQFADFQALSKQLLSAQEEINGHQSEKKRLEDELKKITQKIAQFEQELRQNESARAKFSPENERKNGRGDILQQSDLLDVLIKQNRLKIEAAQEKRSELAKTLELVDLQVALAKTKRNALRKELAKVDRKIWIGESDLTKVAATLDEAKQTIAKKMGEYAKRIADFTELRARLQKSFSALNQRLLLPITDARQLTEWLIDPKSVGDESLFYHVAWTNDAIQTVDRELALLDAKQELEKMRLQSQELQADAMKAWGATKGRKRIGDEMDQGVQLRFFNDKKAEIEREVQDIKNKSAAAATAISVQSRVLTQVKQRRADLLANRSTFIKKYGDKAFNEARNALAKSQENINRQLNVSGQLVKAYSAIEALLVDMKLQAEIAVNKLENSGGIWQRSVGALTWDGIKSTVPDLQFFWDDLMATLWQTRVSEVAGWFKAFFGDPIAVLNGIFSIVIIFVFYFFLLLALPLIIRVLSGFEQRYGPRVIVRSLQAVANVVYAHMLSLVVWTALLVVLRYDIVFDAGGRLKMIFYLVSIPYFCYLANVFIRTYVHFVALWLSKPFQRQLLVMGQILLYLFIGLQFFREAFLATLYGHSELPTLISALQSLSVRVILIILLANHEMLLGLFPKRGSLWAGIRIFIERFYTVFWLLIALLIILSDPYVGYGHLVSTIVQGALCTILLGVGLWFVHKVMKQHSSHLFFSSVGEAPRERFSHAKTWYVLFLILGMVFLGIVAFVLFANIWGYKVSFEQIGEFFNLEFVRLRGELPGQSTSITVRAILLFVAIIFGGFFVTLLFNRFILQRLFLLLEVDSGVQNTVNRISGYIIFLIALVIGLQQIGLGAWVPWWVSVVVFAIGWALKDSISDFFAYFILLIERSVKIGDYVRLNDSDREISGIVRKITPRSVVLRKDNSFYIVVPNSKVINTPFSNWNYAHGVIAFDDIYFTVSYRTDPVKVKTIVLEVLANNAMVLKNPAPIVRVNDFGQDGFEFMLRGFLSASQVSMQWDLRSDVRLALAQEFKKRNIEFAVPTRHVRTSYPTKSVDNTTDEDIAEIIDETL